MKRVSLPGGIELSRMAWGMWRIAGDADPSPSGIRARIEAALESGITTIDQADIYGGYTAEGLLGACLAESPGLRDQIEIVTKCGIVAPVGRHAGARVKHYDTSAAHIARAVETSLAEMRTDRIDLLLIHRPDPLMDHRQTGAALDALVRSGKVRAVGVSNFRPHDWTLLQSAMETPLATNQVELSLSAHAAFTNGDLAFLQERGIRPMAWSPLGGGALTGDGPLARALARMAADRGIAPANLALAWLLANPAGILPVIGTNRADRIRALADAGAIEVTREDWFLLYKEALGHDVP